MYLYLYYGPLRLPSVTCPAAAAVAVAEAEAEAEAEVFQVYFTLWQ
jgi:hypothetical protein